MLNGTYELSRERNDELYLMKTAGGDCYPHFHRHVELYYVISGSSSVTINDKTVTLGAGGLAVATPYDIHSYSRKTDGTAYILIVPPQYLSDFLRYTKGKTISCNFIEDKEKTTEISHLFTLLESAIGENTLLIRGLINTIFGYIFQALPLIDAQNTVSSEFVYNVLTYLKNHLSEKITLEGLAKEFGYSRFHFSKLFNDNFHCNLSSALAILRTHTAITLTENGISESDAAKAAGFSSMRTFYRCFSQVFGMSFGSYKKTMMEQQEKGGVFYNGTKNDI
ncbi:MAG: helix-turn-helix transcriptional regulator [Clostridia bacterium]|nr:helix-turn-helix transcriptional regulator [Clostridia bacterium]